MTYALDVQNQAHSAL